MQPEPVIPVTASGNDEAVMASLGIERIPVDYFHWNGYRYSALKDAIAVARRAQPRPHADA